VTAPALAPTIRVLLVEDNPGDARLIIEMLREVSESEFALERVDRLLPALERLGGAGADVVLLDLGLPDSSGLDTFERIRLGTTNEPIVVISGLNDERVALEAVRAGAQDYLVKGRIEGQLLARVIRYAIERKHAVEALREREERSRLLTEAAFDGVVVTVDGVIREANRGMTDMLGYEVDELLGKAVTDLVPSELRADVTRRVQEGVEGRYEFEIRRKDGHKILLEATTRNLLVGGRRGRISAVRDVTALRSLEQQLRQAQKMEAVGRLAGGVAHDFNNLLTAIFGYADLLAEELPVDHPGRDDLQEIRTAATRASGLTRQLLAFSRQQVLQPVVLSLNEVVENVQKMLQRLLGEDVDLHASLAPELGNVRADAGQIEQVIMNLAVNARDAMPTGGKLTLETANMDLDSGYAEQHQPVAPGRYVMLAVSDTGTGMDETTKAKVFEPFFTTKEAGKGTGLGLATVYGIVKQSGGYIWLYSELGKGTTFKIYLPRVDAPRDAPIVAPALVGTVTGTETVLLAEDDSLLLPLARALLAKLGYKVLEARDAAEALAAARGHQGTIHLLVTDVVMPGGGGFQLAQQLLAERPGMRVLYMSGYTDEAVVRHGLLERGLNYLQKPFTPAVLARRVREVLDAPGEKG
jgi:two-component system cell cycle sensor histidine kinase/response regulator CckA